MYRVKGMCTIVKKKLLSLRSRGEIFSLKRGKMDWLLPKQQRIINIKATCSKSMFQNVFSVCQMIVNSFLCETVLYRERSLPLQRRGAEDSAAECETRLCRNLELGIHSRRWHTTHPGEEEEARLWVHAENHDSIPL